MSKHSRHSRLSQELHAGLSALPCPVEGVASARRPDGTVTRRSWTVWRQGIELSMSFTGSLRHAKDYAAANAQGRHRVNVA